MTQRYRARAMRLIGELEAGDDYRALIEHELKHRMIAMVAGAKSALPSPSRRACVACGADNDPDAEFCKKCGKKMAADPPAGVPA